MIMINSQRAKKLLSAPKAVHPTVTPHMKRYPNEIFKVWVDLEMEQNYVKKLSFAGELSEFEKIILESLASLMTGKTLSHLNGLSLRECEAFLRDRNSVPAIEGISTEQENQFKKFFAWLKGVPLITIGENYHYATSKGPFRDLKLVEKIKELKGFLSSAQVLKLYQNSARPELVDMEELTVYVQVSYHSETEKGLFEELHLLGVEAFQEENLNFIPES